MDTKNIEIGDIILAKGLADKSKKIMKIQNIFIFFSPLKKKLQSYSHAAVYIGYGLILEARNDAFKGVHITTLSEFFNRYEEWVVYRNQILDEKDKENIHKSAEDFLTAGYDINFISRNNLSRVNTYFCSALVVKLFRQAEVEFFANTPALEIPPLFFSILYENSDCWIDVTKSYLKTKKNDLHAILVRDKIYTRLLSKAHELMLDERKEYIYSDGYNEQQIKTISKSIEEFINDSDSNDKKNLRQAFTVAIQKVNADIYQHLNKNNFIIEWFKAPFLLLKHLFYRDSNDKKNSRQPFTVVIQKVYVDIYQHLNKNNFIIEWFKAPFLLLKHLFYAVKTFIKNTYKVYRNVL